MEFERCHPAINFIFFAAAIAGAICFSAPAFVVAAYAAAFAYSVKKNGLKALVFNVCLIPLAVIFAAFFASYSHFGTTVLWENFIGNSITAEAFYCGLSIGVRAAAVCMWFSCLFCVFTSDKVAYLFGRVSPKLSLAFSIVLRMIPRLKEQYRKISLARKAIGMGAGQGNIVRQCVNAVKRISMVITWLLESLATASDSMRSRGYGFKGRTAFSKYRFDLRDRSLALAIVLCITLSAMAVILGSTKMAFAPSVTLPEMQPLTWLCFSGYAALLFVPLVLELAGEWNFRRAMAEAW